ncbi:TonB-dependent receptor [Sphingobium sufflavum]|uniref:TonB-dependent receptor domain-containing protein n=1 Tax=Sphingobium sufflavum TaxID=1129547 RepID=UPI001F4636F6|nr:TonB-dependent receptor [Sphingobium sufflavum]MCE7795948.1 TonB-dependent receptor [Sphingobium sufflavum]
MRFMTQCAVGAALALLALRPATASARPADGAEAEAATEAGEQATIIVTGSRIARTSTRTPTWPDTNGVALVNTLDRDALDRGGRDDLADMLRRVPGFAGGVGPGNSNMQTSGNGLNLLDLRGLGTARTLVLVNGRRMVAGQGGSSAVDLNMISPDLIERVDILTGGASAIYGSDAVAGVVNLILRDAPTGLTLDARSGITDRGDAPRRRIALTAGTGFAGGRGHVWAHGGYAQDGGLRSTARAQSATDPLGPSPFTPQGAFGLDGTIYGIGFDPAKGLVFTDYDGATLQKGIPLTQGYNRNAVRRIAMPVDRVLLNGGMDFALSPSVTLRLEGQYGETRSRTGTEPYAAAGGDPLRDGAGAIEVPGGIALDNPYIPAPIAAEIAARNGDASAVNDVAFIAFRRRLGDVFDRSNANVRRLWRGVAELKGGVAGGWQWDASYVYGRTTDHSAADTILRDRLVAAVDAVRDGAAIVCRDPAARAAGCQPLNLFGADTASPAAIAYLRGGGLQTVLDSRIDQHVVAATLSGTPFRLPAGPARLVLGAEYRDESSVDDWDADTNAGRTLAARADDVRGGYGVTSAFAELAVPLLPRFGVEGAVRLDRWSTVGTVFNWRGGAGWEPLAGLHLRASYGVSSRAPNIAELYTTQREAFPGTLTLDPCAGITPARANAYDADCRRIAGIAALLSGGGTLSYSTAEVQAINGFNGGNPALREEVTRTLTAGIALRPRAIPRLSLSLDYYRIHLSDAIGTQPRSQTVQACLADPASAACAGLVQRLPNGKLARVDALLINGGAIRHGGIDAALDYSLPLGRLGLLDLGVLDFGGRWTHMVQHESQAFAGAVSVGHVGMLQDALRARLGSGFRDRFTLDARYRRGGFSLGWTMRYLGPMVDTLDPVTAPPAAINRVPAIAYHDLQLRMALPGAARREVYLGVYNLLDRAPPFLPSGQAASGLLGVESAQDYDSIGRSLYAGVTLRF